MQHRKTGVFFSERFQETLDNATRKTCFYFRCFLDISAFFWITHNFVYLFIFFFSDDLAEEMNEADVEEMEEVNADQYDNSQMVFSQHEGMSKKVFKSRIVETLPTLVIVRFAFLLFCFCFMPMFTKFFFFFDSSNLSQQVNAETSLHTHKHKLKFVR